MICKTKDCGNLLIIDGDMFGCSKCRKWWHKSELVIEPWYIELAKNESLWQNEGFQKYPSIIAHEYKRLQQLLIDGQTYGAVFQIKDLFEVLLKFTTILFLSDIYWKKDKTEDEVNVLLSLLEKSLSLGDWHRIGYSVYGIMKKKYNKYPLVKLLHAVLKMFEDHKIVRWRNDQIGHGALGFDFDDAFQRDMFGKIQLLHDHFEQFHEVYTSIELWDAEKRTCFIGSKSAFHKVKEQTVIICEFKEHTFRLTPFLKALEGQIYFFDHYYERKKELYLLDYSLGKKEVLEEELFSKLIQSFHKELIVSISDSQLRDMDDAFYTLEDAKALQVFEEKDDYVAQTYLHEQLQALLAENSKGIIHLEMEQGTGKTTFCKALDPLSNSQLSLKDTYIRAYYIDQAKGSNLSNFISTTSAIFTQNQNRQVNILGNTFAYSWKHENYAKELAALLNNAFLIQKEASNSKRLLFIIDGWDEMDSKHSLENILPSAEDLLKGVFILVTSRTMQEMKQQLKLYQRVSKAAAFALTLHKQDESYLQLLKNYLKKVDEGISEEGINEILSYSEHRFLYLTPLAKMKTYNSSIAKDNVHQILVDYVKFLHSLYGEKLFRQLKEILCILAMSDYALTVRDLFQLSSSEKITFKFIAILNDLRALFKVERTMQGSCIRLKEQKVREMVQNGWKPFMEQEVERWGKKISAMVRKEESITKDEQFVSLAVYFEAVEKMGLKPIELTKEEFQLFLKHALYVMENEPMIYNEMKWRLFNAISRYYAYYLEQPTEKTTEFYYEYGNACLSLRELQQLVNYATKAIDYSKLVNTVNKGFQQNISKYCYLVRARGYELLKKEAASLSDYEQAFNQFLHQIMTEEDVAAEMTVHLNYFAGGLLRIYHKQEDKSKLLKMKEQLQDAFVKLNNEFQQDVRYLFLRFKIAAALKNLEEFNHFQQAILLCKMKNEGLTEEEIWDFYDLNNSFYKSLSQRDKAIDFCRQALMVAKEHQLIMNELYSLISLAVLKIDEDDSKKINHLTTETVALSEEAIELYEQRLKIYSLQEIPSGILISIEAIYSVMLDYYLLNKNHTSIPASDSLDSASTDQQMIEKIGHLYEQVIALKEYFMKFKIEKREKSLLRYIGEINAYYDQLKLYELQKPFVEKLEYYLQNNKLMQVLSVKDICYYQYIVFIYYSKQNNFPRTAMWGEKIIRSAVTIPIEERSEFNTYFHNCIILLERLYKYQNKTKELSKLEQYFQKYMQRIK